MLANLLTNPPQRWVVIEPRFANGSTGMDVVHQARDFGWEITPEEWAVGPGETPGQRTTRVFAHQLAVMERWGVKEVRPDLLQPTFDQLRPKKVIVLVRDIHDAATSLVEKTQRDADAHYDEAWIREYLTSSPQAILDLLGHLGRADHRIVRYEDFVVDETVREVLADWLDWPLDGDPGRNLIDLFKHGREVEIHAGEVTDRALRRRSQTKNIQAIAMSEWAAEENREFQRRFGYLA